MYIANVDENGIASNGNHHVTALREYVQDIEGAQENAVVVGRHLQANWIAEIAEDSPMKSEIEFLGEYGLTEWKRPELDRVIRAGYQLLQPALPTSLPARRKCAPGR